MNNKTGPGSIIEILLCILLGSIITLYLLTISVTTYKWALNKVQQYQEKQQQNEVYYEQLFEHIFER